MCDETPEERQTNELAALQAIFGDAVVDNRENIAWKLWRPNDILLTLTPLHNSDVQGIYCSVTLHIKCCASYPDKPPEIHINKMHGISDDNATKLLTQLIELSEKLCGEVMIFELAQHTQQFLHDHNRPTLSFYEEMVQQKTEMEKLKLHDIQAKENEERQKIKDEIQKRQEILRCAGRQRVHRSSIGQEVGDDQGDAPELVCYADDKMSPAKKTVKIRSHVPCTCSTKGAQVLRVAQRNNKKVYIGSCIGHSSTGATTFLAIDDETGERLIAKKWSLPSATDFQTRNKQLSALQQDFKTICRLKHKSLVPYIAMETCKEPTKHTVKQCVYIFRDFILGSSLKYFKSKMLKFSDKYEAFKLLRHVSLGVFSALTELHSESVLHRDLRCENVYLDDDGAVKLVGAGLDLRLAEMYEGENYCDRQTKAQDIYSAAQMLLSIVTPEGGHGDVPPELPTIAKDFFARCFTEDEHSQWSAEQLLNHSFLVEVPCKVPNGQLKDEAGSGSEDEDPVKTIQNPSLSTNSHSRLYAEFEVLTWLGRGAFGDVLKVKNKLDGGFYAIKRVQLNPENVELNKKITREVKLLSRLNHENVVRYYNAWIESMTDTSDDTSTASVREIVKTPSVKKRRNSLEEIVAKLGQGVKVEWSMSDRTGARVQNPTSDSEEDDDDQGVWFNNSQEETSSSIEFEANSDQSLTVPSEDVVDAPTPRPHCEKLKQVELPPVSSHADKAYLAVLYIQMEFCEKHTLRQAIDSGLYQETFRAWRLFREIVEGLAHVHQRGMIHRDLKPVNIFLDSNDHVKIGDFGLATKTITGLLGDERNKQPEEVSGSLTGQVGTALYVAPELLQSNSKVIYNQKVDIYSLGIILFEMFHPPLSTGMERMMVLTDLRTKEIAMPKEFDKEDNAKQIHVIRWLLNHDASLRPTCAELLASEHVPRPVPEGALSGLLSHTLSDRGSRGYQRLVAACLDQKQSPAEDLTYHNGMKTKPVDVLMNIKDAIVKVFRSHGATEFSPPLLIPRTLAWDQYPNAVKVMTSSGSVCHLPHDLRLPFARHVAYTGTKYMRRYVIDRIYREKHVQGFHPREMIECAFDIVTPKTDTLWTDAELLVVASRAASATSLKVTIQLNHTELLKAFLLSCGVPLDKHADIFPVLVDVSFGRINSLQLQTHLTSLCISDHDVANLQKLIQTDVAVYEIKELATQYVKQAKLSKLVSQTAHTLEAVLRNAKALGLECPVRISPLLAYNATQHSGVFWQLSAAREDHRPTTAPKRRSGELIAAGGRYDALVEEFWKVARAEKDQDSLKCSSVGFSMSLERMAAILKKTEMDSSIGFVHNESTLICVCIWGTAGSGRDGLAASKRAQLAKELWAAGYACCPWLASMTDAFEMCRSAVVLLEDDSCVRVACWTNNRVREHKVPYIDVLDFIKQILSPDSARSLEGYTSRSLSWSETEKTSTPITSVTFITASDRMTKNSKRHIESQITTQVTSTLTWLGLCGVAGRVRVCVVACACEAALVRALAAHLTSPLHHQDLETACKPVFDTFIKRQNILEEILIELTNLTKQNNQNRSNDEIQLYALYSIPDSLLKIIT